MPRGAVTSFIDQEKVTVVTRVLVLIRSSLCLPSISCRNLSRKRLACMHFGDVAKSRFILKRAVAILFIYFISESTAAFISDF